MKAEPLQDKVLEDLKNDQVPVSIFTVKGLRLQGRIESYDQYVVVLKNRESQVVYKHAISTILPETGVQPIIER